MSVITRIETTINAPDDVIFQALQPESISKVHPERRVEFATEQTAGLGTKFTAYREKGPGTPLEIIEYEPNRVRMVSDQGGTIWDTVMTVNNGHVVFEMDARPYKFMAKLMVPLLRGMVRKAMEEDVEGLKGYCEKLS